MKNVHFSIRPLQLSLKFIQFLCLIFLFISLAESTTASCVNYGHSCWGGHGKRNNNGLLFGSDENNVDDKNWLLYKLLQRSTMRKIPLDNIRKHPIVNNNLMDVIENDAQIDEGSLGKTTYNLPEDFELKGIDKLLKLTTK